MDRPQAVIEAASDQRLALPDMRHRQARRDAFRLLLPVLND
jgi:hypothetical protein